MNFDPEQFPDPSLAQLKAEYYRLNAEVWKRTAGANLRAGLYCSAPGLLCGVGVFALDGVPWWLNATAGATIATSFVVVLNFAGILWRGHEERRADAALATRLFDEENGRE